MLLQLVEARHEPFALSYMLHGGGMMMLPFRIRSIMVSFVLNKHSFSYMIND